MRRSVSRQRLHQRRFPERHRARMAVTRALRSGRLVRPNRCEHCRTRCRPEAHHARGYDRAHRLDVEWCCRTCHLAAHRVVRLTRAA